MKQTKANIIKLLEAMRVDCRNVANRNAKLGNSTIAEKYLFKTTLMADIIRIIEDKEYFEELCITYELGE